jgi:hypothetical protein
MSRVIVTVQRAGDPRTRELEVSASVAGPRLAELVSRALGWDQDPSGDRAVFQIEVLPLGRRLVGEESLAGAGAWDGSWLIFHQVGTEPRPLPTEPPTPLPAFEQVWDSAADPPTDFGLPPHDEPTPPPGQVQEVAPIRLDPHLGWRGTRHMRPVGKEQAAAPPASPAPVEPVPVPADSAPPAPYDPAKAVEPPSYDSSAPYEPPAWYEPMPLPSFDPVPLPPEPTPSSTAASPAASEPSEPAPALPGPAFEAPWLADDPPTGFPGATSVADDQPTARVILLPLTSVSPPTPAREQAAAPAQPPDQPAPAPPQAPPPIAEPDVPLFRSPDEPPVEQPLRGFRPWRSRKKPRSGPAPSSADGASPGE